MKQAEQQKQQFFQGLPIKRTKKHPETAETRETPETPNSSFTRLLTKQCHHFIHRNTRN
jgi:hypothetical protein